ncbi:MAG: 4Fe-4S binding protein [Phaeodactylibacter sp.]|nr:4Fe-4S binding protein [Phaeodactylibacter sp.]
MPYFTKEQEKMNDPNNIFGKAVESTGAELLQQLEAALSEGYLSPKGKEASPGLNIFGRLGHHRHGSGLSFLAGLAGTGLRAGAFLTGNQLGANYNQLAELTRHNLPVLVHYTNISKDGKAHSSGWDDFYGAGHTGCFQLIAANLQELIDLTAIGHKVAELALLPGICLVDNAYEKQEASVLEADVLRRFLGEPDSHITCPVPAQRLLFGKSRRRIPQWYSLDIPTMIGARKGKLGLQLEGAARERYFYRHLPEILRLVMEEYERASGRKYAAVKTAEEGRADYLLIAQGAAFETAADAARQARSQEKTKVGALSLSVLQPFPKEELASYLAGKKGVAILEEGGSYRAGHSDFYQEVNAVVRSLGKKAPELYSVNYAGTLSNEAVAAAIKNMQRGGARREKLFIGFDYTRPSTSFPQHQVMLQAISREYPGIEKETLSLPPDKNGRGPGIAVQSLPFAIRRYQAQGPAYSSLSRFYHNTACFYQQGIRAELVADPFQALPLMPPATANFANPAEGKVQLPVFQPQNCTGCGACITYCPHSAMPGIAISFQSMARAGMKIAAAHGTPIPQLMGIERKLVKVGEELAKKQGDGVERLADILPEAFQQLVTQSGMEGEKLERAQEGIDILNGIIGQFPIAVTDTFFHQKNRQEKGAAQFFSIAIDPHACTGCGICTAVCEDDALRMAPSEPDGIRQLQANLGLWEQLPDTPSDTINALIREPGYSPVAATLLSRHFYLSLSGGATTENGAPAKTVLHWVTAILESAMQPRVEQQAKELEQHIEELAKNIHQHLSNALPKRDFQLSDDAMAVFAEGKLPLEEVIREINAEPQSQIVDATSLQRKIGLLNDLKALLWALREGPTGGGRSRYGVLLSGNEAMPWADDYPYNAFTAPVIWHWDGSSPERLLGILVGQARHVIDQVRLLRRAALEAKNKYRPELHDQEVGTLDWAGLSAEEKSTLAPVLLVGDARLFSEQNRAALLELLASGLPVKVVVLDDGEVPAGYAGAAHLASAQVAWASALALQHTFLVKGSLSGEPGLFDQLRDGLQRYEPALFHLLAPRPERHAGDERLWPALSQFALQTRAFPGLAFDPDGDMNYLSSALKLVQNPLPEADWVKTTLKYKDKEQPYILTYADWLFTLEAWRGYFCPLLPEGENAMAVADYLGLDEKGRKGKTPAISVVGKEGGLEQYAASPEVVAATRQALRQWNSLREFAGLRSPFPQQERESLEKELTQKYEKELAELKASYEARLQEQEQALMEQVRVKLRDKLLALSRRGEQLAQLEKETE